MTASGRKHVVLGVTGCIAAYKAAEIVRRLRDNDVDVTVVPTPAALNFVGAPTWEALSGHKVRTGVFEDADQVAHINIAADADLVVVAPATADFLARAAAGRADDLLSAVVLASTAPLLVAPAMHTQMWQHPATVANVATLRSRGVLVKNPGSGRLTGPDSGAGRFPDPLEIVGLALGVLAEPRLIQLGAQADLQGRRVLVSAGGTREHIDPVRFIGNESSGRMGVEIARAAQLRGAQVSLVAAHVEVELPSSVQVYRAYSTAELAQQMFRLADSHDVIVMAAAPADFTVAHPSEQKIKKVSDQGLGIDLVQTTDILAELSQHRRGGQTIIGFAAETVAGRDELLALGAVKRQRKGADLLVLNDVSAGKVFGAEDNDVAIIGPDGLILTAAGTKMSVAHAILDTVQHHHC